MKILFAEDDPDLRQAVKTLLERSGYTVDGAGDGQEALDLASGGDYDALIMDWMMPCLDGVECLKQIRRRGVDTPCLMLTARDGVEDRVTGLDAGADDYLTKPFHSAELLARVRALMRRRAAYVPDVCRFANIELDRSSMELRCGGKQERLSNKAFQMMEMLMEHPGQVLSIEQMMEHIWGWDAQAQMNVVWVNISSLRKKLEEIGAQARIRAVRGAGYVLEQKV